MTDTPDLLALDRGSITAPAGCGKTRLIAEALQRHTGSRPILILTHTNAGVSALRQRLGAFGVPASRYRLYTIDGWTMKLIATFPTLAGHDAAILHASPNYPKIRIAASRVLQKRRIAEMLQATYVRLLVDEYQDCSKEQHDLVTTVSEAVPTVVLGDPMQAIFGFRGVFDWTKEVEPWFAPAGHLSTPWRWINADRKDLGFWLLEARGRLERGESIDVRGAPAVEWVQMRDANDHDARRKAAAFAPPVIDGNVLVIGDSKNPPSQRELARGLFGATAVESMDLLDLVTFAAKWDYTASNAFDELIEFGAAITRGVEATALRTRLVSLTRGTAKRSASPIEQLALQFLGAPSHAAAAAWLEGVRKHSTAPPHRPIVFRALVRALRGSHDGTTLLEAALREREKNRFLGRPLDRRGVGSTLLLKGLEASAVVVLDAQKLDRKNLYVAMTRGSHAVVVCSPQPLLAPTK